MNIENFESTVEYKTKLSNCDFDGPLDLLLALIKNAKIEIKDIFVSEVTNQFLEYISTHKIDMEKEGEYLTIATTLTEIKSKAIIPNEEVEIEEFEDGRLLIKRLEEYKLIKEQTEKLKELENTDRFYKLPDESADDVRIVYTDFNINGLIKAFLNVLNRADIQEVKNTEKSIPKEVFSVKDKIVFIRETLLENKSMSFYELFSIHASKVEIITTFQAMLELVKLQVIKFEQNGAFDDITLTIQNEGSVEFGEIDIYN